MGRCGYGPELPEPWISRYKKIGERLTETEYQKGKNVSIVSEAPNIGFIPNWFLYMNFNEKILSA